MILRVDPSSAVPPYEQIRTQVASMVRVGLLQEGFRLPPIRQLANDLGLAGGTVARAYRELEADGVVATAGRHGTVIRGSAGATSSRAPALHAAARTYAAEAHRAGASEDDAVAALRSALVDHKTSRRSA